MKFRALLATGIAGAMFGMAGAQAQTYPDKPIKIVVGTTPGGNPDVVGRAIADQLAKLVKQPVLVENKPGAGGIIANRYVVNAPPDGYTLVLLWSDSVALAPLLYKSPPFDPIADIAYIGGVARMENPFTIGVNPKLPVHNLGELLALAKSSPSGISYSSYGVGSNPHLSFEMLSSKANAPLLHVPYKSGQDSLMSAMAGTVDMVAGSNLTEYVKAGRLRAIVVGGNKRIPQLPDVPSIEESGFGGDPIFGAAFYALAAPAGTPKKVLDYLHGHLATVLKTPELTTILAKMQWEPYPVPDSTIRDEVRSLTNTFSPMVKKLGLNSL